MTTDLYNDFPTDPTQMPASNLDATAGNSQPIDWLGQGLGKLLDTWVAIDTAHQANQPLMSGYYRVPGTNQVQPVGKPASGLAGITPGMILVGVAALALIFLVAKKV